MIDPIARGAVLDSRGSTAKNTQVFQAILDEQARTAEPFALPGPFYVGPLQPGGPVFIQGDNELRSRFLFDPGDVDATLLDWHARAASANFTSIEKVGFYSVPGQSAARRHVGLQFRRDGKSNRNIRLSCVLGRGFSDAFIELPNTWNCSLTDMYGEQCGRPLAQNGTEEGAFLRIGYQDAQPDSMTSSGNTLKNFYMNGCNHGINCQGDPRPNTICFQLFEQIYAENCAIGIYAPTSMDCTLLHCYFEANWKHGAVMGHARIEGGTRHKPGTTDDIVLDPNMFSWVATEAHRDYHMTERYVSVPDGMSRELWAPRYGVIAVSSRRAELCGLLAASDAPYIRSLAGFGPTVRFTTGDLSTPTSPGSITFIAGKSRLWVANRSGAPIEFGYHVAGTPWSG